MGKTVVTVDPTADSLADTQIRPMPITSIGQMLQREQFIFEAEPLEAYSEFNEFQAFDTELADREWEGEVSRNSREYIRWVQQSLNQTLGLRLAVDGIVGRQTRSAIRSFQQQRGLQVDGRAGSQTEAVLVSAGASPPPGATLIPSTVRCLKL